MMRAVSAVLVLATAMVVVPSVAAEEREEIEYVSVVGGWEEGCRGNATLDHLLALFKAVGVVVGAGGFPGDAHCVVVPDGAKRITVVADDASGAPVRVIVSQHDGDGYLAGETVCGAGTVDLLPGVVDVAFTLAPYTATATACAGAAAPTTGSLFVSWA